MPSRARLRKSLEGLLDKAEDCADLAKVQRKSADKQHESAHKLEQLSGALKEDATDIKDALGDQASQRDDAVTPVSPR